jgi:hypothetical protein
MGHRAPPSIDGGHGPPGWTRGLMTSFREAAERRARDRFMGEEDIDVAVEQFERDLDFIYTRRPDDPEVHEFCVGLEPVYAFGHEDPVLFIERSPVAPHSDQEWDGPAPPRKPADARASAVPRADCPCCTPGRPETY